MHLTSEQLWCPRCNRRRPVSEAEFESHDERGQGPFIPFYRVRCQACGTAGALVCRGDTPACRIADDFCAFHGNHVGAHPFPLGLKRAFERRRVLLAAEAAARQSERNLAEDWEPEVVLGGFVR